MLKQVQHDKLQKHFRPKRSLKYNTLSSLGRFEPPFSVLSFLKKRHLRVLINLGQADEVRTFEIAQWFIDNIKNIDFIAFNQKLKAIMI